MRKNLSYIVLCAIAPTTWATEHKTIQPFVGIKGGYQWAIDNAYPHQPPNNALIGLYGGLLFSPSWRWDLGYQYHANLKAEHSSISINTQFVDSALRYDWLLSQSFSLYGRVGIAYWDMNKTHPTFGHRHARGLSPLGEVGAAYQLAPQIQLSTGYQYINGIGNSHTGQYDSHAITLGLTYSFGQQTSHTLSNTTVEPDAPKLERHTEQPGIIPAQTSGLNYSFSVNNADIATPTPAWINDIAHTLNTHFKAKVMLVGHTDSVGTDHHNQALSIRRAQAVAQALIDQGVNPSQIQVSGQGEKAPIASNDNAEGRAKNRRVEATIPAFNVTVRDAN